VGGVSRLCLGGGGGRSRGGGGAGGGGGGGGGFKTPPTEIPKAFQNRAKLKPDCENC